MSASVISGLVPAGKPHPTAKWSLLIALLAVVVLGVPNFAHAGQPAVQAPTGPQSGGTFTGTYTFQTYISCSNGLNFNSSYSNSLDGTHTFTFIGAADGSLLVSIDGGGMQLITSCGDPFTPPHTTAATYTVTKGSPPPPTPTPTPTPVPPTPTPVPPPSGGGSTPTPNPGGGTGAGSGGSSGKSSGGGTTGAAATPAPGSPVSATPTPSLAPGQSPTPTPIGAVVKPGHGGGSASAPAQNTVANAFHLTLAWAFTGGFVLVLMVLAAVLWRSPGFRSWARTNLTVLRLRLEPYWFRVAQAVRRRIHGRDIPKRRGLSSHEHAGKVLAHHHTSYPALAFLLFLSTVLASAVSVTSQAASSQLTLSVLGPPPTSAATIDQPTDGQHFSGSTQTIRGTCPSGLGIEIYRNGSFAGSAICDVNGLYSVLITIVDGRNDLVARDVDGLGQYGPDSAVVTIYYDAPPPPTPTPTPPPTPTPSASPAASPSVNPRPTASPTPKTAKKPTPTPKPLPNPLLLDSARHFYQGVDVDTPVAWAITVRGGKTPYTITWDWSDGSTDTTHLPAAGELSQSHTYSKPGTYQVVARASDAQGASAAIQVVIIVNGGVAPAAPTRDSGNLVYIWPLLGTTMIIVLSLWLGERQMLAGGRRQFPAPQGPPVSRAPNSQAA